MSIISPGDDDLTSKRKLEKQRRAVIKQGKERLAAIDTALMSAYATFDNISDPVLTDACIYEINALRSRRSSVIRELRGCFSVDTENINAL